MLTAYSLFLDEGMVIRRVIETIVNKEAECIDVKVHTCNESWVRTHTSAFILQDIPVNPDAVQKKYHADLRHRLMINHGHKYDAYVPFCSDISGMTVLDILKNDQQQDHEF